MLRIHCNGIAHHRPFRQKAATNAGVRSLGLDFFCSFHDHFIKDKSQCCQALKTFLSLTGFWEEKELAWWVSTRGQGGAAFPWVFGGFRKAWL